MTSWKSLQIALCNISRNTNQWIRLNKWNREKGSNQISTLDFFPRPIWSVCIQSTSYPSNSIDNVILIARLLVLFIFNQKGLSTVNELPHSLWQSCPNVHRERDVKMNILAVVFFCAMAVLNQVTNLLVIQVFYIQGIPE